MTVDSHTKSKHHVTPSGWNGKYVFFYNHFIPMGLDSFVYRTYAEWFFYPPICANFR